MTMYHKIWAQMPISAVIIDCQSIIIDINASAEAFLNISHKVAVGQILWQWLSGEDALHRSVDQFFDKRVPIKITEVLAHGRQTAESACTVHICELKKGLPFEPDDVALLLLIPMETTIGGMRGSDASSSAAYSAIGMSEMLAHEIKNPLAGITGAAQFLSMSLSAEEKVMTDLIVLESKRIVALLNQVEQFGDVTPPNSTRVNIHDVLDRSARSAAMANLGSVEIIKDYDPSLPEVWGNYDQLVQVFLNLIKNACEASDKKVKIIIKTFYDPNLRLPLSDLSGPKLPLHIQIIDHGLGIPKKIVKHIFDPFVSNKKNGKGLGLALVSKIVTQHKAHIGVASKPGFTEFRVSLPISPKPKRN